MENENTNTTVVAAADTGPVKDLKNLTTIIYALYALGFVTGGITSIAAIIVNYIKRSDVAGTLYESHFRWQIRAFWFSALWAVIGLLTMIVLVGYLVLCVNLIWFVYRIVKGLLNLYDNKPMYAN